MNKEYIGISSDSIIVSDENGKISKRNVCCDIEKLLVLENNLEFIDKTIAELESFNKYPRKVKLDLFKTAFHIGLYGIPAAAFASTGNYKTAAGLMTIGLFLTLYDPIGKTIFELIKQNNINKVDDAYKKVIQEALKIRAEVTSDIASVKHSSNKQDIISMRTPIKIEKDDEFLNYASYQFGAVFKNTIQNQRLRSIYNKWQ